MTGWEKVVSIYFFPAHYVFIFIWGFVVVAVIVVKDFFWLNFQNPTEILCKNNLKTVRKKNLKGMF